MKIVRQLLPNIAAAGETPGSMVVELLHTEDSCTNAKAVGSRPRLSHYRVVGR